MEAAQASLDRWKDEHNAVHPHDGILCTLKKKGILTHATAWMNLEGVMLSEIS